MGKIKAKRKRGEERLKQLAALVLVNGLSLDVFTPIHVRVHGAFDVDYWPTTGRAWVNGQGSSLNAIEPPRVIELAMKTAPVVDYEAAKSHIASIVNEEPPW